MEEQKSLEHKHTQGNFISNTSSLGGIPLLQKNLKMLSFYEIPKFEFSYPSMALNCKNMQILMDQQIEQPTT